MDQSSLLASIKITGLAVGVSRKHPSAGIPVKSSVCARTILLYMASSFTSVCRNADSLACGKFNGAPRLGRAAGVIN